MSVFNRDDDAFAAWTKAIEDFAGNPGSPVIVQSPTVLRPLSVETAVDARLAWFRKLIVGDSVPVYGKLNTLTYVNASGKSVADGYKQYLTQLNAEAIKRFVNPSDLPAIDDAKRKYAAAQKALTSFVRTANADWKVRQAANPALTRAEWDNNYGSMGFTAERNLLQSDSQTKYGRYKALAMPYPEVARIAEALSRTDAGAGSQVQLPTSEDDIRLGQDAWDPYYRTNIDLGIDWSKFWQNDAPDARVLNQASSLSTHYEHRWSAGGSVSYGFFSVGGSASGGNIENHFRQGTQNLRMSFKRLVLGNIVRGKWYDGGLVGSPPYYTWVDRNEYWGPNGVLSLIPQSVIIGRGLSIEIDTSQTAYDEFQSWYSQGASGGFSFGPWRVGGGESSSTSSSSVSNTSSGSTVRLSDTSGQAYIIGVISQKMEDLTSSIAPFRAIAALDAERFAREDAAFNKAHQLA
jgi:hypothetical protein